MIYCALVFVLFLEKVVPSVPKSLHVRPHYILECQFLTLFFFSKGGFVGLLFTLFKATRQPPHPSSFC